MVPLGSHTWLWLHFCTANAMKSKLGTLENSSGRTQHHPTDPRFSLPLRLHCLQAADEFITMKCLIAGSASEWDLQSPDVALHPIVPYNNSGFPISVSLSRRWWPHTSWFLAFCQDWTSIPFVYAIKCVEVAECKAHHADTSVTSALIWRDLVHLQRLKGLI